MTLGKRSARAGLQVALEFKRGFLGPEFHRHDYAPRTIADGVNAKSCVVPVQSFEHIGSYSDVVPFRIAFTSKKLDEALSHIDLTAVIRPTCVSQESNGSIENRPGMIAVCNIAREQNVSGTANPPGRGSAFAASTSALRAPADKSPLRRDSLRAARPAEADASAQPRVSEGWCARQGSNLRPTGSKPVALSN